MYWLQSFSLYLAPMAGVSDAIFRRICRELGADVTQSEFVSAEGVLQAWERTKRYVQIGERERWGCSCLGQMRSGWHEPPG